MADKATANGIGHNGPPTREQRERVWLIHLDAARKARANTVVAQDALKAVRKLEKEVRDAIKRDEFRLDILDEILADEALTRADIEAREELRYFMREASGKPNGGKRNLFLALDDENPRDSKWWFEDGYHAGIIGQPRTIPAGCPPEEHRPWQKGWGEGNEKRAWALADAGKNPEKAKGKSGGGPTAAELKRKAEAEAAAAKEQEPPAGEDADAKPEGATVQ